MAPAPIHHPLNTPADVARRRAIAAHPSNHRPPSRRRAHLQPVPAETGPEGVPTRDLAEQSGSVTTEYGLIVVLGATICSLLIKWASGGAVAELLSGVVSAARNLVGI